MITVRPYRPRGIAISTRLAVIAFACLLVFSVTATSGAGKTDLPEDPPNIVVFYIDDASPHDGSLWNDPARTPNIYEHFIERGIHFPTGDR
ncbi:MAG: hypothetical protein ACR2H0_07010 [Candidatus Limnocylindrales bacterium]